MKTSTKKISAAIMTAAIFLSLTAAWVVAPQVQAETGSTFQLAQDEGDTGGDDPGAELKGLKGAQTSSTDFAGAAGMNTEEGGDYLTVIIGQIIRGFLGLLGSVFVILIIYAGFLWMTAGGNEEQIGKAKKMITNSVIGIIIVVLAFAITNFVIVRLAEVTNVQ